MSGTNLNEMEKIKLCLFYSETKIALPTKERKSDLVSLNGHFQILDKSMFSEFWEIFTGP